MFIYIVFIIIGISIIIIIIIIYYIFYLYFKINFSMKYKVVKYLHNVLLIFLLSQIMDNIIMNTDWRRGVRDKVLLIRL